MANFWGRNINVAKDYSTLTPLVLRITTGLLKVGVPAFVKWE